MYCTFVLVPLNVAFDAYGTPTTLYKLQNVPVNTGNALDVTNNQLVVPQMGLYWQHYNTKTDNTSDCNLLLNGTNGFPPLRVTLINSCPTDSQSRDDLRWISSRTQIQLSPHSYLNSRWDWCGFTIDSVMSRLVAFNAYITTTVQSPPGSDPFVFSQTDLNEGGAWDAISSKFTAVATGIYVFSYSVGALPNTPASLKLVIDGEVLYNADVLSNNNGTDMSSRSALVSLNNGQQVWVTGNGTWAYSDSGQLTSFKGFYHCPNHGVYAVWSMHSTTVMYNVPKNMLVPFNTSVLMGAGWNGTTIFVKYAGIYYISIATTQYTNKGVSFYLYQNSLSNKLTFNNKIYQCTMGSVTRESAAVTQAVVGDELFVAINSGSSSKYSSFTGFLVYVI